MDPDAGAVDHLRVAFISLCDHDDDDALEHIRFPPVTDRL